MSERPIDPEFADFVPQHREFTYVPSRTGKLFHGAVLGTYEYKLIRGVPASGKSIACVWDMRYKAEMQPPIYDGRTGRMVRWSRWGVFRKTFQALKRTTIKDWLDWFPADGVTELHESPPINGVFEAPSIRNDGTWVRMELVYYATEARTFMQDLDSLSLSGAYFNEAADIEWEHIHKVQERTGRFKPPGASASGSWKGFDFKVILDTNTPNDSSWWYRLEQIEKPDGMLFFVQPPAMIRAPKQPPPNCKAKFYAGKWYVRNDEEGCKTFGTSGPCENVEHLDAGWGQYEKVLVGASEDYIKTRLLNEYGKFKAGEPVWSAFSDDIHVSKEKLKHERGIPTIVGMDTGGNPAAVFLQQDRMGQVRALGEEYAFGTMVPPFVDEKLIPRLMRDFNWPMTPAIVFADPAGRNRTEMSVVTAYQYLASKGLRVGVLDELKNNDVNVRINAVDALLRRMYPGADGRPVPMFLVSGPDCPFLCEAMRGGYCMETVKLGDGSTMIGERPSKKSKYSHMADGLQYGVLGMTGGGGTAHGMPQEIGASFRQQQMDSAPVGGCVFGCV